MKIALLEFPIGLPGGITTFKVNLKEALESKGFIANTFHITLNTTRLPKLEGYKKIFGFKKKEWLDDYYNTLKEYDYLFFITNCPHLLKNYKDEDWKKCYDISKPKLAWIHDNYYEKYYPWYKEIPEKYNVKIVCPSNYHLEASLKLKGMKRIIPNIINYKDIGLYTEEKKDIIIDPNEFKSIKCKHLLAKQAAKINANIIMFGHTDTLYYSNQKEIFNAPVPNLKILGWQPTKVIYDYMKQSKVLVDLSTRSNTSTFWDTVINEGVAYGNIILSQTPLCPTFKFNIITVNPNFIASEINNIIKNFQDFQTMRQENLIWLEHNLNPDILLQQLLDYMQCNYSIEEPINNKLALF